VSRKYPLQISGGFNKISSSKNGLADARPEGNKGKTKILL